jgi:hypothetical protein
MARPKGARKKSDPPAPTFELLEALEFVSIAQSDIGEPNQTHCTIAQHEVVAFNGILAAGFPVVEDITVCPNTNYLLKALRGKATDGLSITILGDGRLVVTSLPFRAVVPTMEFGKLAYARPDAIIAPLDARFRDALAIVAPVVAEGAQHVALACVYTKDGSLLATEGHVCLEAWHGNSFPPGLMIPKASAVAITKIKYPIIGFGFSASSLTIHYENKAWLKTQLYVEQYPNVQKLLDMPTSYYPISEGFFRSLNSLAGLTKDYIYFEDNEVRTSPIKGEGASFTSFGLPQRKTFNYKYLKIIEPYAKFIDFISESDRLKFAGDTVRGIVMAATWPEEEKAEAISAYVYSPPVGYPNNGNDDLDDEIPF